jgi:glyoxylase-like metal-dependent hydrolase (beta-lactamase superfamily II)
LEIVEGIHRADEASGNMAHSNIYVLVNGDELVVVDTGTAGNAGKIVEYIEKIGHKPSEVSTIILTHYHMDHAGSARDLKDQTHAKVAASPQDAEYITGSQPYPKPKNLLMRAASSLIKVAPVPVDIILNDGDTIANLKVIQTPGHTPGSIALLDAKRKVLFSGDILRFDGSKITGAPRQFTWDEAEEKESIRKISMLDFDVMLPGHGEFLRGDASAVVREYAKSLSGM